MKIKYVPVLRYRREERKALISVKISKKIMPLLELVSERAAQKKTGNFQDTYLTDLSRFNYPILVDIPIYMNVNKGTRENVKLFLNKFKGNSKLKIDYYKMLDINKNIIPTLCYDPKVSYVPNTFINDYLELRKSFNKIGLRIFNTNYANDMLLDIGKVISADDILILDIKKDSQNDFKLQSLILLINKLKSSIGFTSVIIRSAINPNIIFNKMLDGSIVNDADNSLLNDYTRLGFDAFGDFVGIRKYPTISNGGSKIASAGFLYYSWHINSYIGFRGRIPDYCEFTNHIKPSVIKSNYWLKYTNKHKNNCPGCSELHSSISTKPWDWKRYSIQHYLYTMGENL